MLRKPGCAIVTGASRGIGKSCCDLLARAGFEVVALSRNPVSDVPATQTNYAVDLSDLVTTTALLKKILARHDIDTLICNAGQGNMGSLENFSTRQIEQSIAFNLVSPLCIARECIPAMRKKPRSDIVFIGSTSALNGARYGSLYSAAKFGLRGVAQALHHELANANCHVGIVHPGMVRTEFFDALEFEPGPDKSHALLPVDVAEAVMGMIQSPDHAQIEELVITPRHHVVRKKKH